MLPLLFQITLSMCLYVLSIRSGIAPPGKYSATYFPNLIRTNQSYIFMIFLFNTTVEAVTDSVSDLPFYILFS